MATYGFRIDVEGDAAIQMAKINMALEGMGAKATLETKKTSAAFASMGEKVKGVLSGIKGMLLTGLGIGAIFEGFEMIKKSSEEYGQLKIAIAEVRAGLLSTGNAAGVAFEDIDKNTSKLFHSTNFTKAQLMDMQSLLVTFPAVTKQSFGTASLAIADMAARMHNDLKSTTIQVGKALQDPIKGAMALHRVGVNLSKEQMDAIKSLVAQGKKYEAQQMIMQELQTEFAGSAKAAFDNTPLAKFHKMMEDVRESLGETVDKLKTSFEPLLEQMGKGFLNLMNNIRPILEKTGEVFLDVIKGIEPYISGVFAPIEDFAKRITLDTSGWNDYLNIAKGVFSDIYPTILDIENKTFKMVGDLTEFVKQSELAKGIFEGLGYIIESFADVFGVLLSDTEDIFNWLMEYPKALEDLYRYFDNEEEKATHAKNEPQSQEEKNRKEGFYYLYHVLGKKNNSDINKDESGGKGGGLKQSAINTSELGGAKGGLGEAKTINIHIDTMQKIEKITGIKEFKNASEDAVGVLIRALNNISHSQSGTM